ncbi:hypoxia up-regulated protein 1 isoform X1 [Hydra vulgaris]|uniref:hypoxia up-regulated protein 1 isoform X1 n=1 Tax=Hydra vulgaris TaxID=6087 RepID=UPI001F5E6FD1|nr:hypoxia up-regulated protein 1 [Hydra vulgaris]
MVLSSNSFKYINFFILMLCIYKTVSIAVMSVDLGSEWLKIGIVKPGVPMEIALNKESRRKTPFVVSIKNDERLFSDPAMAVSVKHPENAYLYLMHILGKKYDSLAVQTYMKRFPYYKLYKDEIRGTALFKGDDEQLHSVEELFAMILNSTRQIAENFADHPMKDCVLTVPVFFTQAERRALLDAANMTGLNVLQLINDNTAVALNYGIFRASSFNETEKHVMFFDMGASHTTATIVAYSTTKVKDRGYVETVPQLVVKGIGFDTSLGGLEMDFRLRDFLVKAFKEQHKLKKDITESPRSMIKLLNEAKRVRQVLSANVDHMAQVENLFEEKNFRVKVTRDELQELCKDMFDTIQNPIKMALDASSIKMEDIEAVVLMGGGTRVPKVQEKLLEITKLQDLAKNINTDEAAALGSVYKAADLSAGFKVKRFLVKDLNLFPYDVQFFRSGDNDESPRSITRNLYNRLNHFPQKKVMTFNKKPTDFNFNITYGDHTFLSDKLKSSLDLGEVLHVSLSGVESAHQKNVKANAKGVKAFFNLDESGILSVEKVEAHFEKTPELIAEEEQSTFAKLGSKLSSFFGSSKSDDEKVENVKEEKKEEKSDSADKSKEDLKNDEQNKKEEKDEKKSETIDSKTADNSTVLNATTSKNDTSANSSAEAKPIEPVIVKEPILLNYKRADVPAIPVDIYQTSVDKIKGYEARDIAKKARERAQNALEDYLYTFKDKLTRDDVIPLTTEEERSSIEEAFNVVGTWLEEEGFEADEKTLKKKLSDLKKVAEELQFRLDELIERPKAIAAMLQSFNISDMMQKTVRDMPDSKEIYTEKDFKDLEKISEETKQWFMETWKKQNESDPTKKPVLLSKDVYFHQAKLDRELMYLINKAKYYVPKPKPKPSSNTTKSTGKATNNTKQSEPDLKTKPDEPEETTKKSRKNKKVPVEDVPVLELGGEKTDSISPETKSDIPDGESNNESAEKSAETNDGKTTHNPDDKTTHNPEDEL